MTIPEELPRVSDLKYLVEVKIRRNEFVLVARADGNHLPFGITEVGLPVKLADIPRTLPAHSVDGADEILIRDGVGGLLKFPQIFREAGHSRRRVEHYLGAV